jgi:hypothetical protein
VSPVRYELGFCNPEDDIISSHRRDDAKFCKGFFHHLVGMAPFLLLTNCSIEGLPYGSARLGWARLGSARLGSARLGSARLGSARRRDWNKNVAVRKPIVVQDEMFGEVWRQETSKWRVGSRRCSTRSSVSEPRVIYT